MYYKQQYNYIAYIASTVSTFMKVMTPPAPQPTLPTQGPRHSIKNMEIIFMLLVIYFCKTLMVLF